LFTQNKTSFFIFFFQLPPMLTKDRRTAFGGLAVCCLQTSAEQIHDFASPPRDEFAFFDGIKMADFFSYYINLFGESKRNCNLFIGACSAYIQDERRSLKLQ
jgi:hypothetical protein